MAFFRMILLKQKRKKQNISILGESKVHLKGCFTDASCSNTECVETSAGKKLNFCCCTGHMCNSNFKYMPTTTKAPRIGTMENRKLN